MDGFLATSMKISPEVHKVFDRVLSELNPVCLRVFQRATVLRQELSRLSTVAVASSPACSHATPLTSLSQIISPA